MSNPGSNLITGNGTANEIDWVVDAGVQRTDSLTSFSNGAPVLYAYNALTMQPIWSSAYEELDMGGKYNSIAVARGDVFVGTNRIQAFGLTSDTIVDDSVDRHRQATSSTTSAPAGPTSPAARRWAPSTAPSAPITCKAITPRSPSPARRSRSMPTK